MKSEIVYLANVLDDTIKKGDDLEQASKNKKKELRKALSHNVFQPVNVTPDSGYYIPYKWASEGGWLPHDASHWAGKGKNIEDYLTTQQFYDRMKPVEQAFRGFRGFSKSIDSLIEIVPEKTDRKILENVHENSDGVVERHVIRDDEGRYE